MDSSTLSNEVLRLLLAQNNLPITGCREHLLERLNSIPTGVSQVPERRENHPRTRRSDQSQPAPKRARSTTTNTNQPAQTSLRPRGNLRSAGRYCRYLRQLWPIDHKYYPRWRRARRKGRSAKHDCAGTNDRYGRRRRASVVRHKPFQSTRTESTGLSTRKAVQSTVRTATV